MASRWNVSISYYSPHAFIRDACIGIVKNEHKAFRLANAFVRQCGENLKPLCKTKFGEPFGVDVMRIAKFKLPKGHYAIISCNEFEDNMTSMEEEIKFIKQY